MNERIKLPAQEWLGYDPERGDLHGYTFEQMREFAQLIVEECIKYIETAVYYDPSEDWSYGYNSGLASAKELIAKHFGIET